jgi:hypothetical protein
LPPVDLIPLADTFKLTEEPEDDAIANSFEKGTNLIRREERSIWKKGTKVVKLHHFHFIILYILYLS